jgi:serine O-acetyltransferase
MSSACPTTTAVESDPTSTAALDFGRIVDQLCQADEGLIRRADRIPCAEPLPSREVVLRMVEALRSVLFPGYFGTSDVRPQTLSYYLGHTLDRVQRELELQVKRSLAFACQDQRAGRHEDCLEQCTAKAAEITAGLLGGLPRIQRQVASDVRAAFEGDPAATSPNEAIFSYPGILAITNYRLAHELHVLGAPILPRMITEYAHSITGIDIHPGAAIGDHFFIDHGTGVVIGETCIIGNRVTIYQGVTLGAKSFPLDQAGNPIKGILRHPIIEDDVVIYSGATILGRITIGAGSVIGGNVWLTRSLPPKSRIAINPPRNESFQNGSGI